MLVINERIFARSWGFAEKSWYNTFLSDSNGKIKCGETVFNIKAIVPDDLSEIPKKLIMYI